MCGSHYVRLNDEAQRVTNEEEHQGEAKQEKVQACAFGGVEVVRFMWCGVVLIMCTELNDKAQQSANEEEHRG